MISVNVTCVYLITIRSFEQFQIVFNTLAVSMTFDFCRHLAEPFMQDIKHFSHR